MIPNIMDRDGSKVLAKYEVSILNCKVADPCKILEVEIKADSKVADPREIAKENSEARDGCEVQIERRK
jgi:hypothetical protein